ncbi:MAG: M15 family metallopeptidase [Candidatus Dojkabacteria bacterium]|nr:M15 family metallopeptidase [Candidatus Dojkabacteria bacterium]
MKISSNIYHTKPKIKKLQTRHILIVLLSATTTILIGIFIYDNTFRLYKNNVHNNNIIPNTSVIESEVTEEKYENIKLEILNINDIPKHAKTYDKNYTFTIKTTNNVVLEKNQKFIDIQKVAKNENIFVVILKNIGNGISNRTIELIDNKQNRIVIDITLEKIAYNLPFGISEIPEWPNTKYTNIYNNLLIVVDKEYRLPHNYEPNDLVEIGKEPYLLYTNIPNIKLRKEAADALKAMLMQYKKDTGKNLVVASGYRSYEEQYKVYVNWIKSLGMKEADKISARPGYSEHQLGTVVDFINEESDYNLDIKFSKGKAFSWLLKYAVEYGFVMSYPENKENITGYSFEPWHWRYIGIENAKKFLKSGKTLNKFLRDMFNIN